MLTRASESPWAASEPSAEGLRIALFSGNYNYTRDGSNKALNRLVGHLLERGAKVRVYSPTTNNPAFEPIGDLVSVPSVAIPGRSEFRIALGLPRNIARDVADFDPNIVHVSVPDWLGVAAQRLARRMGVPVVASMHTRFETYFKYYGLSSLHRWAVNRQRRFYSRSDHVLVPNAACKSHLAAMGVPSDRIGIWSRGVEHDRFTPSRRDMAWRRSLGYADNEIILLFFGRLVREKGTSCFVETVRELRQRGLRVRPLVVGDGPERSKMEGSLGQALFLGHLEGDSLGRAIASADIFLSPSLTEGFGNVTLEAMAAGLVVVSANVASASSIITAGKDGCLSEADPGAFADKIATLAADEVTRKRLGQNATRTASTYQWPDALDNVIHAYRALMPSC